MAARRRERPAAAGAGAAVGAVRHLAAEPQPPQGGPGPQHQPDYQHQPGYHGYGYPYQTTPMPQAYYQPPRHARPTLPGWVWPLVAVTALVVGLVGGTIGGALVSTSITGDAGSSLFEGGADTPARSTPRTARWPRSPTPSCPAPCRS